MNAMILAAGRGTRLGSLGQTTPKVLVDVGDEPLLQGHLRYLHQQGFTRVVINVHHLADRIATFVEDYPGPLEVGIVREPVLLGTAGGVRNALPSLGAGPFLVLYGDVLVDTPLNGMLRAHAESEAEATLAVYPAPQWEDKGVVELDQGGRISSFVEKGRVQDAGRTALVNAGIYLLERGFVEETIPQGEEIDFGHDVFPAALRSGRRLFAHVLPKPVIDIGTPNSLRSARLSEPGNREAGSASPSRRS